MKRLISLTICVILALGLVGCACGKDDDSSLPDDKRVAVTVDGEDTYLDEAKYYAYSSQATYEVYFITKGKDIDWNKNVDGTTWQGTVKGKVLNDISKRECFYEQREDYNVQLNDEEKEEVHKKITNYYSQSSKKLKDKIGIKKKRLKEVFTKAAIAQKVEDIMNAKEKGSADKFSKKWMDDSSVDCEKCWSEINFNEHIFTLEDTENESGLNEDEGENIEEDVEIQSAE